jgi:hypothetical protein
MANSRAELPTRGVILVQPNERKKNRRFQAVCRVSMQSSLLLFVNLVELHVVPEREQMGIVRSGKARDEEQSTSFVASVRKLQSLDQVFHDSRVA